MHVALVRSHHISVAQTDTTVITQAHVSQLALKCVLAALEQHPDDVDIQAKGLVVLGVLGQVQSHWTPTAPCLLRCNEAVTVRYSACDACCLRVVQVGCSSQLLDRCV